MTCYIDHFHTLLPSKTGKSAANLESNIIVLCSYHFNPFRDLLILLNNFSKNLTCFGNLILLKIFMLVSCFNWCYPTMKTVRSYQTDSMNATFKWILKIVLLSPLYFLDPHHYYSSLVNLVLIPCTENRETREKYLKNCIFIHIVWIYNMSYL